MVIERFFNRRPHLAEQPFRLELLHVLQSAGIDGDTLPHTPERERMRIMRTLKKTVTAGMMALTAMGALAVPNAQARDRHDDVWAGVAAGLAGGIIGGAIASQPRRVYVEPEYDYAPPPPVYRRTYYRPAPRCHFEWVENEWGEAYRARVCY
tara:strand:+ start:341 stop:796 length:456 start_codon:yes stop_codon:yes gene_type:complete